MAILYPAPDDPLLNQGDILKGVTVYVTDADGVTPCTQEDVKYLMVLSRPCNLLNKDIIIVASILSNSMDQIETESFDKIKKFFDRIRDGVVSPDRFYIGEIPGEKGRFSVHFDSLHSIKLPDKEAERKEFIKSHKMATLNTDFLRDLHLRIFCAFARLGFDDYSWYSDEDLSLLISVANTELAELNKTRLEKETELQKQKAKNSLPKTIQSLEKEIHKKIEEIEKFENKINPYKTEQKKRSNPE